LSSPHHDHIEIHLRLILCYNHNINDDHGHDDDGDLMIMIVVLGVMVMMSMNMYIDLGINFSGCTIYFIPAFTNTLAHSAPIPELAPVMITFLSCSGICRVSITSCAVVFAENDEDICVCSKVSRVKLNLLQVVQNYHLKLKLNSQQKDFMVRNLT